MQLINHSLSFGTQAATNGRAPIEFKVSNGNAPAEAKPTAESAEAAVADKPAVAQPTAGLSEAEKARQRAERFGIVPAKDKLAARAKRYLSSSSPPPKPPPPHISSHPIVSGTDAGQTREAHRTRSFPVTHGLLACLVSVSQLWFTAGYHGRFADLLTRLKSSG